MKRKKTLLLSLIGAFLLKTLILISRSEIVNLSIKLMIINSILTLNKLNLRSKKKKRKLLFQNDRNVLFYN